MSKRNSRTRPDVGTVLAVDIGEGRRAFALALEPPLVAFFDYSVDDGTFPDIDALVKRPIAFRIWVMDSALAKWQAFGRAEPPMAALEMPSFVKENALSGSLSITRTGAETLPAQASECVGLEPAAVWENEHVIDRLQDHFAGRPNKCLESLLPRAVREFTRATK